MTMIDQSATALLPKVHVPIRNIRREPILAGAPSGERDREKITRLIHDAVGDSAALVVLDFDGVEVITPSYFRTGLWFLWSGFEHRHELFPILTNVSSAIEEDLEKALQVNRAAAWKIPSLQTSPDGCATIGPLEGTLSETLGWVTRNRQVTAGDLVRCDRNVGVTAWSNRLAALFQQRLVKRHKDGRQLVYSPSWLEEAQ